MHLLLLHSKAKGRLPPGNLPFCLPGCFAPARRPQCNVLLTLPYPFLVPRLASPKKTLESLCPSYNNSL